MRPDTINSEKSEIFKIRRDFASADEYARAMREIHAPAECTGGSECWRIFGRACCSPNRGNVRSCCLGCGGKIR